MTIVTRPALGILAAPIDATVAVKLLIKKDIVQISSLKLINLPDDYIVHK